MDLIWPVVYGKPCSTLEGLPEDQRKAFEAAAVDYLWRWTERVFGLYETTVRPCRDFDCTCGRGYVGGLVLNVPRPYLGIRPRGGECSCFGGSETIRLPGVVNSVSEVKVDGSVVASTNYRVDNHALLVRTDGFDWPSCQRLRNDGDAPGVWEVTYKRGVEVPMAGQLAAGTLACELAKAYKGDRTCQLPQRLQTVSRQGVELAVLDSMEDIDKGHTGIWSIDSWIASIIQPRQPGRVYSPDVPRFNPRRRTWPTS